MSDYNYETFRRSMMKQDMSFRGGPPPGTPAPDFDLPTTKGGRFSLVVCRGKPVLLEFGSISCPMTAAARPVIKGLYKDFRERVEFVSVYVREAHPGERYPAHRDDAQKMRHAADWKELESIPWTVAVDRLDGDTHQQYDLLPNPLYLIDSTGQVAFRALFAGQESLIRSKLEELDSHESSNDVPVNFGEQKNIVIPLVKATRHFDHAVARAGKKAEEDFQREMGGLMYGMEKLMSKTRGG